MSEQTPEEIAKEVSKKESARADARRIIDEARIAINAAGTDKNVELVLRYVMRIAGFHLRPTVVGADGELKVNSTLITQHGNRSTTIYGP
jgi:hypothetical protein